VTLKLKVVDRSLGVCFYTRTFSDLLATKKDYTMLNIYQIVILENEIDPCNAWESPKFVAQQKTSVFGVDRFEDEHEQFYDKVCETTFTDLGQAFHGMNMWTDESEAKITRLRPLHSLSVGDIVHNTVTGKSHMCARFGWAELSAGQTARITGAAA